MSMKYISAQKIQIEGQVLSAEAFAARIYNEIGQIRVGLHDPDVSADELSQLVQTFQNGARELVRTLDSIQGSLGKEKLGNPP